MTPEELLRRQKSVLWLTGGELSVPSVPSDVEAGRRRSEHHA